MKIDHDFTAPADGETLFWHPERKELRFRPFKALHHFRELLKDKEDTEQVFHIFEALPRRDYRGEAKRFVDSDQGKALQLSEVYLPDQLDDHDTLRTLPEGSLGHAYCDFMEKEGLSAAGLVEEFNRYDARDFGDQIGWYSNRQRDTHDLLHVLTGYGRDALGEQCVLAFTYGQSPAMAHLFIAYAGAAHLKKTMKTDAPIFGAVNEAKSQGKLCPRITDESIMELLAMPLEEARAKLNITPPAKYHEAHKCLKAEGIDPYDLLNEAA
jgi:ubiquinone biosynthesis protein COQ4